MDVQIIAVDMDGTFLNDRKDYNRDRFLDQYAQMKRKGIRILLYSTFARLPLRTVYYSTSELRVFPIF